MQRLLITCMIVLSYGIYLLLSSFTYNLSPPLMSGFNFVLHIDRVLNTSHAFSNIVHKHGVRGLWKGWAPNVQRAALVNMGGKFDETGTLTCTN